MTVSSAVLEDDSIIKSFMFSVNTWDTLGIEFSNNAIENLIFFSQSRHH